MLHGPMMLSSEDNKPAGWIRFGAALYYCAASMTVQFSNKALFTLYGYHFPILVTFLQMLFIAPVCYIVARPSLQWDTAKGIMPLAFVNVLNVVAGLLGTAGLNIPMFIALRRFTLVATIALERLLLGKQHEKATLGAVGVMIGGALVAAATDLSFHPTGYAAVLANDLLTALYLIRVKATPATQGLSTTGLLFYNATLSLPLLAVALAVSWEPPAIWAYPGYNSAGFRAVLGMSCMLGLTINHSTFVCTRYNDPLTTSVAGNLKNVLMTFFGALSFGDFVFRPWNAAGLAISMAGAVWYATKTALRSVQKSAQHKMLMRDPAKQIGRDRLTALRNANSIAAPQHHNHNHNHNLNHNHAAVSSAMGSSASRTSSGKLPASIATASPRQPETA